MKFVVFFSTWLSKYYFEGNVQVYIASSNNSDQYKETSLLHHALQNSQSVEVVKVFK